MTHYYLAAALSTHGISGWLRANAVPLIILVVGLGIVLKAQRGEHRTVMKTAGIVLVGLMVIGLATGGWQTASTDLVHMVGL